jgi:hypothetical protein
VPTTSTPPSQILPILSLAIALLAVFIGPLVTLRIGRTQIGLSRRIASKQIVAPMRQAWINTFREKLAEFTSAASHYWNVRQIATGTVELKDEEQRRLAQLEHEIELLINPSEQDHKDLVETIKQIPWRLERGTDEFGEFNPLMDKATALGQRIFKTEWDRIKNDIERP